MLRKNRRQTFLLQTNTCLALLVHNFLRMVLARGFLPLAHKLSLRAVHSARRGNILTTRFLSLANELARESCHCDGVKRQKQSHRKQHLFLDYFATLVMTKNKMATRRKASRHDNLLLDRHTAFAMTILNLPAVLA